MTDAAAAVSGPVAKPSHPKVGKLRPSQVVTQHGPGAVVDLPELSVIVAGINHWYPTDRDRVIEPRLERFVRASALYRPPQRGVPAFVFPEWLVCPHGDCRRLAPWKEFSFTSRSGEFVCTNDAKHAGRKPPAFPARFMVACPRGHLDDFPWWAWVHRNGLPCTGMLQLIDTGTTGAASDLLVKCTGCDLVRPLGEAFRGGAVGPCTGRRPWLGPADHEADCPEDAKTILRGASNAYFSVVASALSIPPWSDPIQKDVAPHRAVIGQAESVEKLRQGIEFGFYNVGDLLERYTVEQIWNAVHADPDVSEGLKPNEYKSFLDPSPKVEPGTEFEIARRAVHDRFRDRISLVVAATRLREVRALRGFTRIDSGFDLGESDDVHPLDVRVAKLGLPDNTWLPAVDLRGEGVFLELDLAAVTAWEARPEVRAEHERLAGQFDAFLKSRDRPPQPFPGMRYVLLHTLAHSLIRQFSLDCGYSSSALRERIYCATGANPMAGLLIYTATTDSDGSLGGLVDQADPDRLGQLLLDALREAAYCASDPLCGGGDIAAAANLNGAACHACELLAETSCEFGNRLLDRAVLVETLGDRRLAFFGTP